MHEMKVFLRYIYVFYIALLEQGPRYLFTLASILDVVIPSIRYHIVSKLHDDLSEPPA